jgi:predicted double-glycine peptidase
MYGFGRSASSAAAALLVCAVAATPVIGQPAPESAAVATPGGSTRLLDVPFLSQTEDLCGGAALAMVLRYWGARQVYPDDFAALVDRSAAGIRTDVLVDEVRRRRWHASLVDGATGSRASAGHLDRGRPLIALIEVRPNRYHYVVIVAWTGEQVIVHDPARAPFQVMPQAEFDRAWTAAGRWALLVLPGDERPAAVDPLPERAASDRRAGTDTCGPLIQTLVTEARAGNVAGAERGLLTAVRLCPEDPAAWRELAGVQFVQGRWAEAGALAERAAALDPEDEQGVELLATSRFLNGEPDLALAAWNRIGRPSVDLIRVVGLRRTRHPVVVALVGLPSRTLLTVERYGLAARRLNALPSAVLTRLRYRPVAGGLAEIDAVVVERPTVPRGAVPVAAMAARAWLDRELRLDVATPTGSGELWTVAWRPWTARPRLAVAVAAPSNGWLPGVTTIEGFWERQSYEVPGAVASAASLVVKDQRLRTSFGLADWATHRVRWTVGAAFDRWADDIHVSVNGGLEVRRANDRVSIGIETAAWMPTTSGSRFATASVWHAARSTADVNRSMWTLAAGLEHATSAAPFAVWPGAGTGRARVTLLRAHPLLDGGVVTGAAFARRLAHATAEYQHPVRTLPAGSIRVAAFGDAVKAWSRLGADARASWQTDVGAGLRLTLPGNAGTMRADIARGLRDRRLVVSAGWLAPWPGR